MLTKNDVIQGAGYLGQKWHHLGAS